ncbi:LysR substrate-binding domain-containing protein [Eremococcus coleocola]|uniref:LysR substrate-binding domain-containing protein n=1 Tax=Eremococcus coleocola TaxID=88132 RepID=UPI000409E73C|nr:LysR substrate-binding domain-containing protein [Eremococcus coleocola]
MNLEITQMYYLKHIVESNYNLTEAARKIHISQPALSRFISNFEENNDLELFVRKYNRLTGLTSMGKLIYDYIIEIINKYEELEAAVEEKAAQAKEETIIFGATTTTPQVLLPKFFAYFTNKYPHLQIKLVEGGAVDIAKRFKEDEFEIAFLVEPQNLDVDSVSQTLVYKDEIAAFMSVNHPLSQEASITWEQVASYPIMSLSKDFMTYHKTEVKFKERNLNPTYAYISSSWHYLMDSSMSSPETITLMPSRSPRLVSSKEMIIVPIEDPAYFPVYLTINQKNPHSPGMKLLIKELYAYLPKADQEYEQRYHSPAK